MIIPTTPARLFSLVRSRLLFIAVSSSVAGLGALCIGLMTPYLYHSEAVVQVESKTSGIDPMGDNTDLFKTALVAQSQQVLRAVAHDLSKGEVDLAKSFPLSISLLDLGRRLRLVTRHLASPGKSPEGGVEGAVPEEVMTSLLERHLRVDTDPNLRTVKVVYEAGDPIVAREICTRITDRFLEETATLEQQELRRQEKYLTGAIEQQFDLIHKIEAKMRDIVEKYPQMTGREEQRGTTLMAQRYLEKQEQIKKMDEEMKGNEQLLTAIEADLSRRKEHAGEVNEDLTAKILDEINQLEYKRLQFTKVSGYSESHPEIIAIKKRIRTLRRILSLAPEYGKRRDITNDMPGLVGQTTKNLYEQIPVLREQNRKLKIQKEAVSAELKADTSQFKEVVKVNFDFDSLTRELTTNMAITQELYRDLQKTRLSMAGAAGHTSLLSPPSLNIYSSNVSVNKRTVFGFFVGMAMGLSLLLLLDLVQPLLLLSDDLELLHVRHYGTLRREKASVSEIAYCIMSVKTQTAPGVQSTSGSPQTIAFFPISLEFPYETYVSRVTELLRDQGGKVALVLVEDPDAKRGWNTEELAGTGASLKTVGLDEVPASLNKLVGQLRLTHEWVFVLCPGGTGVPFASFVAGAVDSFFYVTQLGVSELKAVQRIRNGVDGYSKLGHHALVFQ